MPRQNRYNPNTGKKALDFNDRRLVATHEAGHAVAAVVFGHELVSVDIKRRQFPDGGVSLGFTNAPVGVDFAGKGEAAAMPYMVQGIAGPLAESLLEPDGDSWKQGYRQDLADNQKIAAVAICGLTDQGGTMGVSTEEQERNRDRIIAFGTDACEAASRFVDEHLAAIHAVADALLKRTSLTGDEVAEIVREHASHEQGGEGAAGTRTGGLPRGGSCGRDDLPG